MSGEYLHRALAALDWFRAVIILELGRREEELHALGPRFKPNRMTEQVTSKIPLDDADLAVSEEDQDWFLANNAIDLTLYETMRRTAEAKRAA